MPRAELNRVPGPMGRGEVHWGPVRHINALKALTDFSPCPQTNNKLILQTLSYTFIFFQHMPQQTKIISLKSLLALQRSFQPDTLASSLMCFSIIYSFYNVLYLYLLTNTVSTSEQGSSSIMIP